VIVGGLIAMERYGRRNAVTEFSSESPRLTPRTPFNGIKGWLAFAACALPVLLGFIVPLLFLLQQSIHRSLMTMDTAIWRDAVNSVIFAALATLVALALGLATILATRCRGWSWRSACYRRCWQSTTRSTHSRRGSDWHCQASC